jgi:glycosyltransferase involved in cell wall biosynthesis
MSAPRWISGAAPARVDTLFFLETAVTYGGPQKRLLRIASAWAARGHATAVAALRGDEASPPEELARFGVPIATLTRGGKEVLKSLNPSAALAARSLVRALRPELVVTMESLVDHQVKLGLLGGPGRELPIVTLLGIDRWRWESKWHRVQAARLLGARRGAVIGNSQRCLDAWCRVVGDRRFKALPHAVLHNPVDPSELAPCFARDTSVLRVGGLGRFEPQKGFDLLVRAFAELPEQIGGREVVLSIQGRGRGEEDLRELARGLGLERRFELLPFTSAIEPFLHSLACLVVPSRWAGFENVALESILSGTPTLCSRETGLDELPENRALRFFALDPGSLAFTLRSFLQQSDADRRAIAEAQRAFVVEHLDLHVVAERLERFLAEHALLAPPAATAAASAR